MRRLFPLPGNAAELLLRCAFPPAGEHLDCAVSGGPDSLGMMVLAAAAGCKVTAWHVDHGLRPGSAGEADVVRDAAERLGARFEAVKVDVPAGPNLEARAREARLGALPLQAATGHTADDQAETVLLNLMRGSGLDGLSAMRLGPHHPILALRRTEVRGLVEAVGLEPACDPSNSDPAIRRNSIRQDLIPIANRIFARDVLPIIARQAAMLKDDADLLNALASQIDPCDAQAVARAPAALAAPHPADLAARGVTAGLPAVLGGDRTGAGGGQRRGPRLRDRWRQAGQPIEGAAASRADRAGGERRRRTPQDVTARRLAVATPLAARPERICTPSRRSRRDCSCSWPGTSRPFDVTTRHHGRSPSLRDNRAPTARAAPGKPASRATSP